MRQQSDADEPLGREVWVVAIVVTVGVIMSILDTTIVNVALETLSRQLDASLNTIQWVSTGYMLALAVVIPLTGWMSERFGAKQVWMVSVALVPATILARSQRRERRAQTLAEARSPVA